MATQARGPGRIRAVFFDLDEALLVREGAWCYAVEEAVASVTGRRIEARALAAEYRLRPWRHALAVLLAETAEIDRCETLAREMFIRSAMKRLLIYDGMGMALDRLRGARLEMGAVSREPHAVAIRQIESTGLDRFLTVLSPTPPNEPWDVAARLRDCLGYVEREAAQCAFVSADAFDLRDASRMGLEPFVAGWAGVEADEAPVLEHPDALAQIATLGAGR